MQTNLPMDRSAPLPLLGWGEGYRETITRRCTMARCCWMYGYIIKQCGPRLYWENKLSSGLYFGSWPQPAPKGAFSGKVRFSSELHSHCMNRYWVLDIHTSSIYRQTFDKQTEKQKETISWKTVHSFLHLEVQQLIHSGLNPSHTAVYIASSELYSQTKLCMYVSICSTSPRLTFLLRCLEI